MSTPEPEDSLGLIDGLDEPFMIIVVALITGIIGVITACYLAYFRVLSAEKGSEKMVEIADSIKIGAKAFLNREYMYIAGYVCIMLILIGIVTTPDDVAKTLLSFIIGAILSGICGYIGMLIAVEANVRTANAARTGLNEALIVSFASGGVMGLSVVSIVSLGLSIVYVIWLGLDQNETRYLAGFGFGASSIALFARVGGGIYTKAADVGADLVGKVEANIPEDDPKNPATIADNVGDNVGDVAGMGADLFESFAGSIIASVQLAEEGLFFFAERDDDISTIAYGGNFAAYIKDNKIDGYHFIALPFWIMGFGTISSIIGLFLVRTNKKPSPDDLQSVLLWTIRRGIITSTALSAIMSLISCGIFFGFESEICWRLWGCVILGLVAGELIGLFTEYTTSFVHKPTQSIAKKSRVGAAGVVIQGLAIGMLSTAPPMFIIVICTLACYYLAGNYGIAIAAVGMLSTLGITLSTDAFGPVADNAGGIAEMAELDMEVRERTDGLDALGNTTAATGKGFCIGSAVLATLALLAAYKADAGLLFIDVSKAEVLISCIAGACLPYIFAALTMLAVGRAASLMIQEVRRQFRDYKLLEENPTGEPDYSKCVEISTKASLIEMIIPGVLAVLSPLITGFMLGREALGGLLIGALASGCMLAIFMANAGGAWDNAKKWIEAKGMGHDKAKGTDFHKATVVGDTIGDPFKDTSGPALNILIKLMTTMSILFAPIFPNDAFNEDKWWIGLIIFIIFMIIVAVYWFWMRATGFGRINYDKVDTLASVIELGTPLADDKPKDEDTKEPEAETGGGGDETNNDNNNDKLEEEENNNYDNNNNDNKDAEIESLKKELTETQDQLSEAQEEIERLKAQLAEKTTE